MRRNLIGAMAVAMCTFLAGCGITPKNDPGVADVDFTPRAIVSVDENGFNLESTTEGDASTLSQGTVIEIHNDGSQNHRVQGLLKVKEGRDKILYDTGIMFSGDSTTIVLSTPGEVSFREMQTPEHAVTIEVTPKP